MEAAVQAAKGLRIMFYGVGPNEMAGHVTAGQAPDAMVQAVPYFFLMIGVEAAVALAKGRPVYRMNDTVVSILQGSVQMLWQYWLKLMGATVYVWIYDRLRLVDSDPQSWATWLGSLLLVDCCYYWMHRYAHVYHLLWSAHSVHHSGEDYNLATALRQGAMQPFFSWIFKLPSALFFHPLVFAQHSALNTLYQFWVHTTLVGDLGPLEYVLNTPSHHRMHHRPPGNCNYGGVLIIFDRMFGTFVGETEQRDYYGLVKQYETFDPVYANVEHLRRLQANVDPAKARGLSYFASLLFKRRVNHRLVFRPQALFAPLPQRKRSLWAEPAPNKRQRYDGLPSAKSPMLRAYVVWLFLAAMAFSVAALLKFSIIQQAEAPVVQFVCFLSYICIGRLFDGLEKGHKVNTARVLAFLCLSSWLITVRFSNPTKDRAVHALQAFSVLDGLFWFATYSSLKGGAHVEAGPKKAL